MSWSHIRFGEYWAHAHDDTQIVFMSLAPECLAQTTKFSGERWLHEWAAYWIDHRTAYGNGCTDIGLHVHLTTKERVEVFRAFLSEYKRWLETLKGQELRDAVGDLVWHERAVWFADLIEATIDGNTSHRDPLGREMVMPMRPDTSLERTREG